jgi:AcrR family transcriptional regulator
MPAKPPANQSLGRRTPAQARSLEKVELILEAATRIIDRDGLTALSTNRVAEIAGVSIGTLYQYFPNKQAILAALGQREAKAVSARIIELLAAPGPSQPGANAREMIAAVFGAFGGRTRVHRVLLEHQLAQEGLAQLDAMPALFASLLAGAEVPGPDGKPQRLSRAEAFVLTHAFGGVIRASIGDAAGKPPRAEIEQALERLVRGFLAWRGEPPGKEPRKARA